MNKTCLDPIKLSITQNTKYCQKHNNTPNNKYKSVISLIILTEFLKIFKVSGINLNYTTCSAKRNIGNTFPYTEHSQ